MACKTDPALEVIELVTSAVETLFGPDENCPPLVGATTNVRFLAGDGAPLEAWESHGSGSAACKEPFVWLRVMRRYRSQTFPSATIDTNPCGLTKVIALEIGVAWCAVISPRADRAPKMDDLAREAEVSLDVAWRLEEALCLASTRLTGAAAGHEVGTDTIVPYGPDADIIAWSGVIYVSY